jgi:large subunit ribosomal protein L17
MRHRIALRKLNRTTSHRRALRRNLAQSLFEHGQITTTLPKAKDVQRFTEKLITLAKKAKAGDLGARRRVLSVLTDRAVIATENQSAYDDMPLAKRKKVLRARTGRRYRTGEPKAGMAFTAESIVRRLIEDIAPQFADRPGGYTRVVKLAKTRIGDNGAQAVLQLVGKEEDPGSVTKPKKTGRRRRADSRYAAAAKGARRTTGGSSTQAAAAPAEEKSKAPANEAALEEQAPPAEAEAQSDPESKADET